MTNFGRLTPAQAEIWRKALLADIDHGVAFSKFFRETFWPSLIAKGVVEVLSTEHDVLGDK